VEAFLLAAIFAGTGGWVWFYPVEGRGSEVVFSGAGLELLFERELDDAFVFD